MNSSRLSCLCRLEAVESSSAPSLGGPDRLVRPARTLDDPDTEHWPLRKCSSPWLFLASAKMFIPMAIVEDLSPWRRLAQELQLMAGPGSRAGSLLVVGPRGQITYL